MTSRCALGRVSLSVACLLAAPLSAAVGQSVFTDALGQGQISPKATLADSDVTSARIYGNSFDGITLRPADAKTARQVIKRTFLQTIILPPATTFERLDSILGNQDIAILALLRTKADSDRYMTNVGRYRMYKTGKPMS
jgi:hypothetical protein